jgi:hypothetical protein
MVLFQIGSYVMAWIQLILMIMGWSLLIYDLFPNFRANAIQRNYGGACVQMRLSCSSLAPFFLYLIQWLDCGCCYALPSYLGLFHILICKVPLKYGCMYLCTRKYGCLHLWACSAVIFVAAAVISSHGCALSHTH